MRCQAVVDDSLGEVPEPKTFVADGSQALPFFCGCSPADRRVDPALASPTFTWNVLAASCAANKERDEHVCWVRRTEAGAVVVSRGGGHGTSRGWGRAGCWEEYNRSWG